MKRKSKVLNYISVTTQKDDNHHWQMQSQQRNHRTEESQTISMLDSLELGRGKMSMKTLHIMNKLVILEMLP